MKSIVPLIPALLMFTFFPAIYGGYIKLSARLLRYRGITWKQGFVFGFMVVICNMLIRAASVFFRHSLPLVPGILLGLIANCLIGAWYFSGRGGNTEEGALGIDRAINLTGIAFLMLGLTGVFLIGIARIFSYMTMP